MAKVFLFQTGAETIFLEGTFDSGELQINTLQPPNSGRFKLVNSLRIRGEFLAAITPGGDEFRFRPGPTSLTLTAELLPTAPTFRFFGKNFNGEAKFGGRLIINIPIINAPQVRPQPFFTLEVCAVIKLNIDDPTGDTEIESDPLCFTITLDKLPDIELPSIELPKLSFNLPDIGWRLPTLRLPWDFPTLPDFPFHLPSLSLPNVSFPLKVTWKAIHLGREKGKTIIDIEHLTIEAPLGVIEADLHIVVARGKVDLHESYIKFYRPDFLNRIHVLVTHWHYEGGCLILQWEEPELNAWLRMIAPDLADTQAVKNVKVSLRLLWDGNEIDEVRFDWEAPRQTRLLNLPGFKVSFPPISLYSLVVRRDEQDDNWLSLLTSFGQAAELKAESTFSLTRATDDQGNLPDRRELHHDAARADTPLIAFTAKTKRPVSLMLLDLPLGGEGHTKFFRQIDQALLPFDFDEEIGDAPSNGGETGGEDEAENDELRASTPTEFCRRGNYRPVRLRAADWEQPKLHIDVDQLKQFVLPILKNIVPDGSQSQLLKITGARPGELKVDGNGDYLPVIEALLDVEANLGKLKIATTVILDFDIERFAFRVRDDVGIKFSLKESGKTEFLGLEWEFTPDENKVMFILVTKDGNYQLKQAPGSKIIVKFTRLSTEKEPIRFEVKDFVLSPKGVNVTASIIDSIPVRLLGIDTHFRFTAGTLQIHENRIADFTIAGTGLLPPALVGAATADIALHFGQREGRLTLLSCDAQLQTSKPLRSPAMRFQFSITKLGLRYFYDGRYHLYFTLTGTARYVPQKGDDKKGPLAWLPGVEMQLNECPLTGDWTVLRKHIKFLVTLPEKKGFDFLGAFKMDISAIGLIPQADVFNPPAPAILLSGQIFFTKKSKEPNKGDVLTVDVEFHQLYIGLPKPGSLVPQIHFKDLTVKIGTPGFKIEGRVDYIDEEIEPGLLAKGFFGHGSLAIGSIPEIAVTMTFIRVSPDDGQTWTRAWFVYAEVRRISISIPVYAYYIFIREAGLGFGYRYTLASIRSADELDDPRLLLKELQRLSLTQGNLSRRDQWRIDLEKPGEDARWTIAFRALISQTSGNAPNDSLSWNESKEKNLPCLFVTDAVIGFRSDLTFLMATRVWLFTNYNDFRTDEDLRNRPHSSGFALLAPRKKRLLIHAQSNDGGKFGNHPPLFFFIEESIKRSRHSFTLLAEPKLLHIEVGWPNQLGWDGNFGPLKLELRGGALFRLTPSDTVVAFSLLGRASFDLSAGISLGFVGASISAHADIAFGGRMIGAISFTDVAGRSAIYTAVGIEMRLNFSVEFWIRIKIWRFKITKRFHFNFEIGLTFFLEQGITGHDFIGVRGTATVSLRIMGHGLHFGIHFGINSNAVEHARQITEPYLHLGLEATEVEPVPGDPNAGKTALAANIAALERDVRLASSFALGADTALDAAGVLPDSGEDKIFEAPDYTIFSIPLKDANGKQTVYFLLLPGGEQRADQTKQPFLPVPPDGDPANDFRWTPRATSAAQIRPFNLDAANWGDPLTGAHQWRIRWDQPVADDIAGAVQQSGTPDVDNTTPFKPTIRTFLRQTFITDAVDRGDAQKTFEGARPIDNPDWLPSEQNVVEDRRVHNQTDDAVEAAVRGAAQQFEGSPYLKRDARSPYEQYLKQAFDQRTTVYMQGGQMPEETAGEESLAQQQQATQLRGVVINQLISELQQYVALIAAPVPDQQKIKEFIAASLAFQMGLVFQITGQPTGQSTGWPDWLDGKGDAGTIKQRLRRTSPEPDSDDKAVRPFNTSQTRFDERPPQFQRVRHYTDANTIAITWDLVWPPEWTRDLQGAQQEPEHHLQNYVVRRRALAGDEPEVEFRIKNAEVLNRTEDDLLERLRPRFQLVDHFNEETREDQAALPPSGKSYIYTITPVDVAGIRSSRPLTIVATRRPNEPPPVLAGSELVVKYRLKPGGIESPGPQALVIEPDAQTVLIEWPRSADPQRNSRVAIDGYRLVFRKETTFPAGAYVVDGDTQSKRSTVLPTTNARPLRTDVFIEWNSAQVEPVLGQVASEANLGYKITLGELIQKGIFPANRTWRPEAWRIFLQTRSRGGVYSALSPVQVVLRFRTVAEELTQLTEERRPGLLEWIANPLRFGTIPPEDERAEVGNLHVPMPLLDEAQGQDLTFKLGGEIALRSLLGFGPHPDHLRAIRFEWNQGPSEQSDYPLDLHAGYQLYEFDLDAHTAEVLDEPAPPDGDNQISLFDRMQLVQELELLPPEDLLLTPTDNSSTSSWEAWYPSAIRRRQLRAQASETIPAQRSDAEFSPWYAWRDSYLQWPDDQSLVDPLKPAPAVTLSGPMAIDAATMNITSSDDGFGIFKTGQFVRISGASFAANNGIKRIVDVAAGTLTFEAGSFTRSETAMLTLDGSKFAGRHPLLQKLLDDLAAVSGSVVDVNVTPPQAPGTLHDLFNETAPRLDPYGWNILKRMGLAACFLLRDPRTGDPLEMSRTLDDLRAVLDSYPKDHPLFRHLHIEHLFQPGRSRRLPNEAADVAPDQLLALVQISLRPAIQQVNGYVLFEISDSGTITTPSADRIVKVTIRTGGAPCRLVEMTEHAISPPAEIAGDGDRIVLLPPSGRTFLLFQSTAPAGIDVAVEAAAGQQINNPAKRYFPPTDWLATYFNAPGGGWPQTLAQNGKVQQHWERFTRYLLRLNPASPSNTTDPKIELPMADDLTTQAELLTWLERFFDASGDVPPGAKFGSTGNGPWIATAYQRAVSPVGVNADAAGRLKYYHPVEDQWAHAYRYYVLPHGRYDRLWQALAQSERLYPDDPKNPDLRLGNLQRLREFQPPPSGGLDVVLDRTHSIVAPLVLFAGRLDLRTSPASPALPGKTWEVIIAKHHEQQLVERNRTLQRQLSYRQMAHTLLRRFAYADSIRQLQQVLEGQQYRIKIKPVEGPAPQSLPGAYEEPEQINLLQPSPQELLSLDLHERIRSFSQGAIVLQWEALPFYYEHRLLIVAQSDTTVSPVTDVLQRDFEYLTPAPQAEMYVAVDNGTRRLMASIRLANYWECLPPDTQDRWRIEEPAAGDGDQRKLSSLPDTDVLYQVILERGGVIETQADLTFNSQQPAGYEARPFGKQITVTPVRIITPGIGERAQDPFHLETALAVNSEIRLKERRIPVTGEFTRAAYGRLLLELTPAPDLPAEFDLAVVKPDAAAPAAQIEDFVIQWYAARVISQKADALSGGLGAKLEIIAPSKMSLEWRWDGQKKDDVLKALNKWIDSVTGDLKQAVLNIEQSVNAGQTTLTQLVNAQPLNAPPELARFINVPASRYLLRFFATPAEAERAELLAAFAAQSDKQTLAQLFDAIDDRDTINQFFGDWNREQAISRRAAFSTVAQGNDRITFPTPVSCVLALDGKLSDDEIKELFSRPLDVSFETALRQLIERMNDGHTTFAEATIGFEQLREISDQISLPTAADPKLRWRGAINEEQQRTISRWADLSIFGETFKALLGRSATLELAFEFDVADAAPKPEDLAPVLRQRLRVAAPQAVWTGLILHSDEEQALSALGSNQAYGESFRQAIQALLADLTTPGVVPKSLIELPAPTGWHPRPQTGELSPSLQAKLLIGNARLRFSGWMTKEEAHGLQQNQSVPDQQAVARLFRDSAQVGMQGWRLRIQARRGGANIQSADFTRSL